MVGAPRPRNRRGEPIDPVPFLVTTGLAFTLVFSFGPLYGLAYGLSLPLALAPPVDAGPLPSGQRFERLLYAGIGLGVAFLALTLPLL